MKKLRALVRAREEGQGEVKAADRDEASVLVDAREAEDLSSRGLEICRQVANIGDDTEASLAICKIS